MADPTIKMDAQAATGVGDALRKRPAARVTPSRARDPFRLGSRIRRGTPAGPDDDGWIPLSAEDLVYPEEGEAEAKLKTALAELERLKAVPQEDDI